MKRLLLCLLASTAVHAAASYDQSGPLMAERTAITSEFAAAQAALKAAKTTAQSDAAQARVGDVGAKILALRDKTAQANDVIISILSGQPGYPFLGARDPSATIKATYIKMVSLNSALKGLSFTGSAPYQPKDINSLQVLLDRTKIAIDEHAHAAQNIATRLVELQRAHR